VGALARQRRVACRRRLHGDRHIGALPQPFVPSYTTVDMRVAWQAGPHTELALVARNLSDPQHAEWGAAANRVEHERQWVLQWRWRLP
jgi:iron complex outermembrane receptor protein